jgi:GR25 family glycosyltransferase involved in LPS biosynthesis
MAAALWLTLCAVISAPSLPPSTSFAVSSPSPPFSFLQSYLSEPTGSQFTSVLSRNTVFSHVDSSFMPEMLAYLDSIAATTWSSRLELRNYIQTSTHHATIVIQSQNCDDGSYLDVGKDGEVYIPYSLFDMKIEEEWEYYYGGGRKINNLYISNEACSVVGIDLIRLYSQKYVRYNGIVYCGDDAIYGDEYEEHEEYDDTCASNSIDCAMRTKHMKHKPFQGSFVINLDRRIDRYNSFLTLASPYIPLLSPLTRVPAVDGRDLDIFSPEILSIFSLRLFPSKTYHNPHQNHGFSPPVLGNALSHYSIWTGLASDDDVNDEDYIMVLEDDIDTFEPEFASLYEQLLKTLNDDPSWDITFLGTFSESVALYNDNPVHYSSGNTLSWLRDINVGVSRSYGGGSHGYIIRKRGASALLHQASTEGIQQAIDWFILESISTGVVKGYKTVPNLIHSKSVLEDRDRLGLSDVGGEGQVEEFNHRVIRYVKEDIDFYVNWPKNDDTVFIGKGDDHSDGHSEDYDNYVDITIDTDMASNIFAKRHSRSRICLEVRDLVRETDRSVCKIVGEKINMDLIDFNGVVGKGGKVSVKIRMINMFEIVVAERDVDIFVYFR